MTALLLISTQVSANQFYTVRKGDTLYSIAKRYSTTVSAIEKANGIDSRKSIHPDQQITIPSDVPESGARMRISGDKVEVKADGEKIIATLAKDAEVTFVEEKDGMYAVKLSDGQTGYVPADSIEVIPETKAEAKADIKTETKQDAPRTYTIDRHAFGREVARAAYACRGARYRRGGTSVDGFDCSGFVKYVYESQGVKLPRTSSEMYRCGHPVSKEELQEGDLVFFANTYRRGISHVGMYLGDGEFIHASTTQGGVRVDKLDDAYFRGKYAGARRIKEGEG